MGGTQMKALNVLAGIVAVIALGVLPVLAYAVFACVVGFALLPLGYGLAAVVGIVEEWAAPPPRPPMTAAQKAAYRKGVICRDEMAIRSAKEDLREAEDHLKDDRADVFVARLDVSLTALADSDKEYAHCIGAVTP